MDHFSLEDIMAWLAVWLIVGWILIYPCHMAGITDKLDTVEKAGYRYVAVVANVFVLLLWPIAPIALLPFAYYAHKRSLKELAVVQKQYDEIIKRQQGQ